MDPTVKWLLEHVERGVEEKILCTKLFAEYHKAAAQHGFQAESSISWFGTTLRRLFPWITTRQYVTHVKSGDRWCSKRLHHYENIRFRSQPNAEVLSDLQTIGVPDGFVKLEPDSEQVTFAAATRYTADGHTIMKELILNSKFNLSLLVAGREAKFPNGSDQLLVKTSEDLAEAARDVMHAEICLGYRIPEKCEDSIFIKNCDAVGQFSMKSAKCQGLLPLGLQNSDTCTSCLAKQQASMLAKSTYSGISADCKQLMALLIQLGVERETREFIVEQVMNGARLPSERHWSDRLLKLCVSVHCWSPRTYSQLRSCAFLTLPDVSTLDCYQKAASFEPPDLEDEAVAVHADSHGDYVTSDDKQADAVCGNHASQDEGTIVQPSDDKSCLSEDQRDEVSRQSAEGLQTSFMEAEMGDSGDIETDYQKCPGQRQQVSEVQCDHQYANISQHSVVTMKILRTYVSTDTGRVDGNEAPPVMKQLEYQAIHHCADQTIIDGDHSDASHSQKKQVVMVCDEEKKNKGKALVPKSDPAHVGSATKTKETIQIAKSKTLKQQQLHEQFQKYIEYDEKLQKKVFKCPLCGRTMSAHIGFYTRHLMQAHNGGQKLICDICKVECKDKVALKQHMNKHTLPFKCDECTRQFARLIDLQRHVMKHKGENPFQCAHCPYKCRHVGTLKAHMRNHQVDGLLKCDVAGCSFTTAHNWSLKTHQRSKHSGEKHLLCEHCSYVTSDASSLRRHIKLHLGQKQYMCSRCPFRGVTRYDVVRHMRSHTHEKIYFCDRCSFSTAYSSALRVHMMMHLGVKPWQCSVCGYNNIHKAKVNSHITSKHSANKHAHIINLGLKLQMNPAAFCRPSHPTDNSTHDSKMISTTISQGDAVKLEDEDEMEVMAVEEREAVDCIADGNEPQLVYITETGESLPTNIAEMDDNTIVFTHTETAGMDMTAMSANASCSTRDVDGRMIVLTSGDEPVEGLEDTDMSSADPDSDMLTLSSSDHKPTDMEVSSIPDGNLHPHSVLVSRLGYDQHTDDVIHSAEFDSGQLVAVADETFVHTSAHCTRAVNSASCTLVKVESDADAEHNTIILSSAGHLDAGGGFQDVSGEQLSVSQVEGNVPGMSVEQWQLQLVPSTVGQDQLVLTEFPGHGVPEQGETYQCARRIGSNDGDSVSAATESEEFSSSPVSFV